MKNIVVLYHADCPDGFGGAWAAYKKFGNKAEYIGVYYGVPLPEGLENKEIYLIDFVYDRDILEGLIRKNKRVTAIDHHFSKEDDVKITQDYLFSVNNSGAVLAWKYFYPDKKLPKFLEYIEDRDLYRFHLPNSRAVCAFVDTFDLDFKVWDRLADDFESDEKIIEAVEKGGIIVKYEEELVERLIHSHAKLVEFEGYEVFAVNAPHDLASDIGALLCKKKPPLVIIWREEKDLVSVSLRSDGTLDVSPIAKKFGGGGHKRSAGFRLPAITSFPWSEIKSEY